MTTNVCFALLDQAVIGGRGDLPVVEGMTHARLLEEAAALAGVLHHLGVGAGTPVAIDLQREADAVVAALAVARLGGVVTTEDPSTHDRPAEVGIVSAGSTVAAGRHRVVRRDDGDPELPEAGTDLDWSAMLRAGREEPAACRVLEPTAAYSPERSVAEQIALLGTTAAPYGAGALRRLLQV